METTMASHVPNRLVAAGRLGAFISVAEKWRGVDPAK
jgi:hypothetical protein